MINVILCGSCGKMGGFVTDVIKEDENMQVVCGVDKFNNGARFPDFISFSEINV